MIKSNPTQENGLRNAGEHIRLMPVLNEETVSDFSDFAWFPRMISDSSSVISYFAPLTQCVELELRWRLCVHGSTCPEIYL